MSNRLLVIGGSGYVGSLVLPYLQQHYTLRVFDLKPPALPIAYLQGDVRDFPALQKACDGCDLLLYMAMGGGHHWHEPEVVRAHFDANITGVYLALRAAAEAGIPHAAHCSSMSVFGQLGNRFMFDEDQTPDEHHHYGLTKRLGEEVCRAAWREWKVSVNALRLCLPVSDEKWPELAAERKQTIHTAASDVAAALHQALQHRFGGFQAFTISGEYDERTMRLSKAKAMLGWQPLARPAETP